MNPWSLVPLPSAAALLGAAVMAVMRKGPPAGRTVFALSALSMALPVCFLSAAQTDPTSALTRFLHAASTGALLAFPALWLALAFRLGRARKGLGQLGSWLVLLAALASGVIVWAGAFAHEASAITIEGDVRIMEVGNLAARSLLGVLLLAGAAGVVFFQSLWESARRTRRHHLHRASAGFLLSSLTIFLLTGQTLLYGGAELRVLSLTTLGALPAALAAVPAFLCREEDALVLPDRTRCGTSSGVLMGLGGFLIALAVLGEAIERIAPAGRRIWFHWGGAILVGGFACVWLVPGLRGRLRTWFRVPMLPARYDWDWRTLLAAPGVRPATSDILARVADVFQESLGPAAAALWIRADEPAGYEPWSVHGSPLPFLRLDNPLPAQFRAAAPVVDLTHPPSRLAEVAAYVENLELVERQGFRLFVGLSSGEADFGILAFAPRGRHVRSAAAPALELAAGPLAVVVWGALLAATPEGALISGELWMRAADLLHHAGEDARVAFPDRRVGERLATWAAACAERCTERAAVAVGRLPMKQHAANTAFMSESGGRS